MTANERIAQFRKLVETNSNDELAQFGLGSALLEAGQAEEAGPCFQRVLAINSRHSKAYQLLGTAQKAAGRPELAVQTLTDGYRVAHRQGDLMPMKAMGEILRELGAPVPTVAEKTSAVASSEERGAGGEGFQCRRCGGTGPALKSRPFKGELGERILATVCQACWAEWVRMGTRVINELRLPLHDSQAQAAYDEQMKAFLILD